MPPSEQKPGAARRRVRARSAAPFAAGPPPRGRARFRGRGRFTVAALLCAVLALFLPAAGAVAAQPRLTVSALQADYATHPLGIDDAHPSLSWQLGASANGARQAAYRILVATTPDRLTPGRADVWDSGKVASAASVGVAYGGPALRSAQRYYWTVQAWDAQGNGSGWAASTWWETGLLTAADWQGAQWISPDTAGQGVWSDFDLDTDFTIVKGAASVVFRAKDANNLYMWQVNSEVDPGKVMLRPHVEVNGSFAHVVPDIDISQVVTQANVNDKHHLRIEADGPTITTWIDGTQVSTLTDSTFTQGTIGFRVGDSTEDSLYGALAVHGLDGSPLFSDDFSADPDPSFPQAGVTGGQLEPRSGIELLDSSADAPMLRHDFTLGGKKIAQARAYVDGLGLYELHVNGKKIGDDVLSPADTPYDQRDLYRTYDVTSAVRNGANAVGIWLGNGYGTQFSPYGFRWTGPKQATMLLEVTYTDGTRQAITTGSGWTWANGPITANDMYAGETYDARLASPGWDLPGFDASGEHPVTTVAAPGGSLVADDVPPVRVTQTLRPVRMTQPQPGVYVYDLGQDIAGWEQLKVAGPAGTTVRMRTAEEVGADGMLDTTTNRSAASTDRYTLAGTGGTETYEPRFTYHGFRYVEVTGYPGTPTLDSIAGRVVHADVASTATFSSSDPMLDRIWQNNQHTILNNSMSLPTDNPVRDERTPPGMDVQAYHDASTGEFGMDRFYASYLRDMPPGTALPNDAGNAQNPDMGGDQISLAWTLYQTYGDKATLAAMYPAMKAFVDKNATDVPGHIWPADHGFGDWCPPVYGPGVNGGLGSPGVGSCTSEVSLVNTSLSYLQATDTALAAQALGQPADAAHYTALASDIKDAFNAAFLNSAHDGYADGRQTTSILPLAFGMVPAADLTAVGDQLVHTITVTNQGHLDTGIFGTRYLMDALSAIGRTDLATSVLDQKTYPGFGYEISQGATTDWEEWTYASSMESHDHAMFSGINASFTSVLGGIGATGAGYGSVDIAPQVPAGLDHVSASVRTVRGQVSSSWTRSAHAFTLDVAIPVNSTATVSVPLLGHPAGSLHPVHGAKLLTVANGVARYAVGSGDWHFTVKL
ncbi:alpha-L-rhamnosidase [Actinacidiphila yanglinensis]|uniref:alpha-L-rhamnosidase n=1 Tax=Actinacidiphila yanglinensis TaxID=310779 RepID=A0A1H5SUU8_9ACTN|nr:family 78 glycoside hydrolase catalytic domain [Actinacidiphila yanglinensis]SEF54280.1 alpha-L-rhamnosidase [Actinacidiphila yanglinensis]